MLKYQRRLDSEKVSKASRVRVFDLAVMKCMAAIFCEIINIMIITTSNTNEDILKDFVVMGFIIEIDNLFAKAVLSAQDLRMIGEASFYIDTNVIRKVKQGVC